MTDCAWWTRADGQRLFSVVNTPADEVFGSALLLPAFGRSSHNHFAAAFHLARAGFRTLRIDGRNNVGASDGEIVDYKLGVLLEDARFAAARLADMTGSDDFLIFGASLSTPVALMLARDYPRAQLVLLVPVVDVCETIDLAAKAPGASEAYRRREPDLPALRKIFDHDVRAQAFVDDLVALGLDSVDQVLKVARSARGRTELILGDADEFLAPAVRDRLVETVGAEESTLVLENVRHNLTGSPAAIRKGFSRLAEVALNHFRVPPSSRRDEVLDDAILVAAARIDRMGISDFLARHGNEAEPSARTGSLQRSKEIAAPRHSV
jgi:pimeloyl-ACP methyl ester carboxylesterase